MIGLIFYIALLETIGVLIVAFLRQKGFYFRSVQMLFITTFSLFALIVFCDLTKNYFLKSESVVTFTTMIGISAALIGAIAVEHAASTLHKGEENSWKMFFSEKNLPSVIFKGSVISLLILTWALTPFQTQLVRNVWGDYVYSPVYEGWYLISLSVVAIATIVYPSRLLVLSSRKFKEKEVVNALKWFGVCWVAISFALIYFHGFVLSYLRVEMVAIEYLLIASFFGVMIHFFGKTTILESFFKKPYSPIPVGEAESVFVTYTPKTDKVKRFSTFILEGLTSGKRVIYKYPDNEDEAVRRKMKEHGVDVERYEENGSLILKTLSQFYLSDGLFDGEKAIKFLNRLKADSLKKGYRQLVDFVDLDDFSFLGEDKEKYIEYLNDERWRAYVDDYVIELFAANAEKVSEKLLQELTNEHMHAPIRSIRSFDLIEHVDVFSKALGLTRQELAGRTILFEFDPTFDYEKPVVDFVTEALANVEPVALFTHKGSVIYSALSNRKAIKILLSTQRISAPQVNASTNEILLPANNIPLLLDALEKMLKRSPHDGLNIVFESLSSLILLAGFEKTYKFVRYALDMLVSENSTALFLFSPDIHDRRVTSSLRSLFSNHVSYRKGSLQIVKLPEFKVKAQIEGQQ
jgi:hypothetical protein